MSVAQNTRKPETVRADLAARRVATEKRARAQIDVLKAEIFLRRCRDTADALERLQMHAPLGFFTLADLTAPQPWAIANGVVLGHLLTMEEGAYLAAMNADAFDALSLDDVMRMEWSDAGEYAAWAAIYVEVLRAQADLAEQNSHTFSQRDELRKKTTTAGGVKDGVGNASRRREGL